MISSIESFLHADILKNKFTYIEPFVGSGAILFWMLNNFPNLKKAVINDINSDLINTYKTIAKNPNELFSILICLHDFFNQIDSLKHKWMLSNSDVKGKDVNDDFFDGIYMGVPFGRAFRSNFLLVPHKRISTAIPNAKLAS